MGAGLCGEQSACHPGACPDPALPHLLLLVMEAIPQKNCRRRGVQRVGRQQRSKLEARKHVHLIPYALLKPDRRHCTALRCNISGGPQSGASQHNALLNPTHLAEEGDAHQYQAACAAPIPRVERIPHHLGKCIPARSRVWAQEAVWVLHVGRPCGGRGAGVSWAGELPRGSDGAMRGSGPHGSLQLLQNLPNFLHLCLISAPLPIFLRPCLISAPAPQSAARSFAPHHPGHSLTCTPCPHP